MLIASRQAREPVPARDGSRRAAVLAHTVTEGSGEPPAMRFTGGRESAGEDAAYRKRRELRPAHDRRRQQPCT